MPPQRDTMMGKRQMLPMPTAEPIHARIKPHLPVKLSREWGAVSAVMLRSLHFRSAAAERTFPAAGRPGLRGAGGSYLNNIQF